MAFLAFIKKWALLCAIVFGSLVYLLFSQVPMLQPFGNIVGPHLVDVMPILIFLILYVTFCKIRMDDFRPHKWHFWLQGIRTVLSALVVLAILHIKDPEQKILFEGIFICVICPTAAAAAVITEKLGGSIASMTVYTIIANCFTSVIIPLFFPMIERAANITFMFAFFMVLKRVVMVLVVPLCLALLTRRYLPKVAGWFKRRKNLAFYIWSINLSILMGFTLKTMLHAQLSTHMLLLMLILPLFISLALFGIGKFVGHQYGDSISGGQALGQKNTIVGIWLTITFLNPLAVIAPCAYMIWQNIINTWQLWYKEKYGILKW